MSKARSIQHPHSQDVYLLESWYSRRSVFDFLYNLLSASIFPLSSAEMSVLCVSGWAMLGTSLGLLG